MAQVFNFHSFPLQENSSAQCELTFLPILHGNLFKKVIKSTLIILTVLCVIYHLKQIEYFVVTTTLGIQECTCLQNS